MPLDGVIHKAAYKGDFGTVDDYLKRFPQDVNIPGAQNRTPLHRAIGGGLDKKQIVELLLAKKANPNLQDVGGLTPLHWAASFGYTQYGAMLIQAGATVDSASNSGESALHFCAEKGHLEFAKLLIANNARIDLPDKAHNTPYDVAKRGGHKECMEILKVPGSGGCCVIS